MSIRVLNEVFDHSHASGTDLCVLIALADAASHDGVTWLPIEADPPKKSITSRAHCSKSSAIRAVQFLEQDLQELQVVKVRRRSSFVNVYRVVVGSIADVEVDYERIPFELPYRFGEGVRLTPSPRERRAAQAQRTDEARPEVEGVSLTLSSEPLTVSPAAGSRCQNEAVHGVNGTGSTVSLVTPEPSRTPAAEPPAEPEEHERPEIPAAAESRQTLTADVKRIVDELRHRDAGTVKAVEAIAVALPLDVFEEVAETVHRRRETGRVANDAGLLIQLLRVALEERRLLVREQMAASVTARGVRGSWVDTVKREQPDAYVRYMASRLTDRELSESLGDTFDAELRELARAIRDGDEPSAPLPESPWAARERWIAETAPTLPIVDVRQIVAGWDDVDDVERTLYLERVEAAQAAAAVQKTAAA